MAPSLLSTDIVPPHHERHKTCLVQAESDAQEQDEGREDAEAALDEAVERLRDAEAQATGVCLPAVSPKQTPHFWTLWTCLSQMDRVQTELHAEKSYDWHRRYRSYEKAWCLLLGMSSTSQLLQDL